ncbi:hypothetical protein RUM43_006191 [Polyplax serrata]|uniref:Uncharacterized protein n=1 Tax=Polyplax serrata TaxID=468196 RepID=A0AAN8NRK4_POLSC
MLKTMRTRHDRCVVDTNKRDKSRVDTQSLGKDGGSQRTTTPGKESEDGERKRGGEEKRSKGSRGKVQSSTRFRCIEFINRLFAKLQKLTKICFLLSLRHKTLQEFISSAKTEGDGETNTGHRQVGHRQHKICRLCPTPR